MTIQEDDPGWDCTSMGNQLCGPSQGGPTVTEFEWVQFETCPFSSPAVASPECSTEVTTGSLTTTAQPQPAPSPETLPVTGAGTAALLVLASMLLLMGISSLVTNWYIGKERKEEDK